MAEPVVGTLTLNQFGEWVLEGGPGPAQSLDAALVPLGGQRVRVTAHAEQIVHRAGERVVAAGRAFDWLVDEERTAGVDGGERRQHLHTRPRAAAQQAPHAEPHEQSHGRKLAQGSDLH